MGFGGRRSPRTNFLIVSVMMVGAGLIISFLSLRSINYRQTEGQIIQSDVTGTGKSRRMTIRYVYAVDGASYENNTVSYSLNMFRESELLAKYPAGKTVPIYYSITDPTSAVLEKGFSFGSLLLTLAGVGLFVGIRRSS